MTPIPRFILPHLDHLWPTLRDAHNVDAASKTPARVSGTKDCGNSGADVDVVLEETVLVAEDVAVVDVSEAAESLITETVPLPEFATKISLFPESYVMK